jgi:alpha 1,3-glucosidase
MPLGALNFKSSSQAAFAKRGRSLADRAAQAGSSWRSPYSIDPDSLSYSSSKSSVIVSVKSSLYPNVNFELQAHILKSGVARIKFDEVGGLKKRYDEAASWALISEPSLKAKGEVQWKESPSGVIAVYDHVELVIDFSPLKITLRRDGSEEVILNGRGLFHMEHFREKLGSRPAVGSGPNGVDQQILQNSPNDWFEGPFQTDDWEETWLTWTDSRPKGNVATIFQRSI